MKLIIAYIRPEQLNEVKQELVKQKILKISVTNALGCGDELPYHEKYRGLEAEVSLHKKVRLEIAIEDTSLDKAVDAICKGAATGEPGDGKVFVLPIEDAIRIRTGVRGPAATD